MKKLKKYLWPLGITVIMVALGFVVFYFLEQKTAQTFYSDLRWTSDVSLTAINPDRVKRLSNLLPNDISNNDDFLFVDDQIISFGNLFKGKGIDAIYLLSKREGSIYFIAESTPKGDPLYVTPGQLYEKAPAEAFKTFSDKASFSTAKYTDEFGSYISQFSPIINKQGEQVGVLGVDVDYNYYQLQLSQLREVFVIIWFFVCIFVLVCFFYFENLYTIKRNSIASEQKIMAISNSINDGVVVINSQSQIVFWNKTSEKIFGYSFNDVLGLKFKELVKLDEVIAVKTGKLIKNFELVNEAFDYGDLEIKIKDKKKNITAYELSFSSAEINKEKHLVAIFHDISRRNKERDELETQKDDLEKLNNLMVGRELKMIELKKALSDLKNK